MNLDGSCQSSYGHALFNEAEERLRNRDVRRAIQLYEAAEAAGHGPDACAGARWVAHMLLGDFESAWRESDAIERRGAPDPHRFWNGQPLEGKDVLIRCLHGLGDTIQFIRYAPLVRMEARRVTIEAQPALKQLLSNSKIADEVITWGEREPHWDVQVEVMELPRIFRTTAATVPNRVPYLLPDADCDLRRGSDLHVGLVWAGSQFNPARTVPLKLLSRICGMPGVRFFSLQADPDRVDLQQCEAPIMDLHETSCSVSGAAAALLRLDLTITVDTMMAHLSGALGIPTWTLLPFEGDWRWGLQRTDSPWYPTMRLFRQPRHGDWSSVVGEIANKLVALVQAERTCDVLKPTESRLSLASSLEGGL